ncbi:hypothetical protein WJX73_009892 [Symbiochloris irregularis]|uniref:Uncharacterized protein n=1 Tax=Symbiochloris irregularis TaxID=706552 RepID=A0AAW1P4H9_9CHLO
MSKAREAEGKIKAGIGALRKRKSAQLPWLGTEDQLCRAVKRLQTDSRPTSAVTSQDPSGAGIPTCSAQGVQQPSSPSTLDLDEGDDASANDESAGLRGGMRALRLTRNGPFGARQHPSHDDEDESAGTDEVQEPLTPGREEAASPTQQTSLRSGRLGKRANSAASEDAASYELLYEEANALLKNLHFQRIKRIAATR